MGDRRRGKLMFSSEEKLGKKGKTVFLKWKITTVQYQKKCGDRVHCTWYNPLHRLT